MKKEDIILVGGGGHCKSCIDVIEYTEKYNIKGILDLPENLGKKILSYDIIGSDEDLPRLLKVCRNYVVSIGQILNNEPRKRLYSFLVKHQVNIPVIVSPLAYVSKYSDIGSGTMIFHHALVNADVKIGENCIINSKSLIEHDVIVNNHCHISTGSIVNGGVKVGEGTFYGSGAVSKEYISIPQNSFIKANSIVK